MRIPELDANLDCWTTLGPGDPHDLDDAGRRFVEVPFEPIDDDCPLCQALRGQPSVTWVMPAATSDESFAWVLSGPPPSDPPPRPTNSHARRRERERRRRRFQA